MCQLDYNNWMTMVSLITLMEICLSCLQYNLAVMFLNQHYMKCQMMQYNYMGCNRSIAMVMNSNVKQCLETLSWNIANVSTSSVNNTDKHCDCVLCSANLTLKWKKKLIEQNYHDFLTTDDITCGASILPLESTFDTSRCTTQLFFNPQINEFIMSQNLFNDHFTQLLTI
jgi:hypothetical protein